MPDKKKPQTERERSRALSRALDARRRPVQLAAPDARMESMRELMFRPGEGRANVMASDLPLSARVMPAPGDIEREPGGRSGLIPTPPYFGDYQGSYDIEERLYGRPSGSGASAMQMVPPMEGGVARFQPELLPDYRQALRNAITYESLRPSDGRNPTARANYIAANSPEALEPFSPGERERLAAPQKRAAKKGK